MKKKPCLKKSRHCTVCLSLLVAATTWFEAAGNVVGYVNTTVGSNQYALIQNPLDRRALNNALSAVIPASSLPVGCRVWLWDSTNQVFHPPSLRDSDDNGPTWSIDYLIPVGRGFVFHNPISSPLTLAFTGEVLQGSLTNFVAGANKLSLLGSMVPQAGGLSSVLAFPPDDGDSVYQYAGQYLDAKTYYVPVHGGWPWPGGGAYNPGWYPSGPIPGVAEAFFVRHRGPDKLWVRNFTVAPRTATGSALAEPSPSIESYTFRDGTVTLKVKKATRRYHVQFSTDRVNWTDIAVNQTTTTWKGRLPAEPVGFFQVVNP